MSQATADVLHAAADLLERTGWCQGVYVSDDGACCALGAIAVNAGHPSYSAAYRALYDAVGNVSSWNDAPERTKDEVVAKLREVAAQEAKS